MSAPAPGDVEFTGSGIAWAFRSIAKQNRQSATACIAAGDTFMALMAEVAAEYFESEADKADRNYGTPTVESAIGKRGIASGVLKGGLHETLVKEWTDPDVMAAEGDLLVRQGWEIASREPLPVGMRMVFQRRKTRVGNGQ